MTLSLSEIFVLAACGKLALLEGSDDLSSLVAAGSLHDGSEAFHRPIQNVTPLLKGNDPRVEKDFEECCGNGTSS
jgi:hypothetical protein